MGDENSDSDDDQPVRIFKKNTGPISTSKSKNSKDADKKSAVKKKTAAKKKASPNPKKKAAPKKNIRNEINVAELRKAFGLDDADGEHTEQQTVSEVSIVSKTTANSNKNQSKPKKKNN